MTQVAVLPDGRALAAVLARCGEQCAGSGSVARLLAPLPAILRDHRLPDGSCELAACWGRAMARQAPSEDELLWLGGVWLAAAYQILGADSEGAEALARLFAQAAERALTEPGRTPA